MYLFANIFGRMVEVREVIEYVTDDNGETEAVVNIGCTAYVPLYCLEVRNAR